MKKIFLMIGIIFVVMITKSFAFDETNGKNQIEGGLGLSSSTHSLSWSYEWDYKRLDIFDGYDISTGYLNEGHLYHNFQDGVFIQFWKRWNLSNFNTSVSAGPYFYNDTTDKPINGVGVIFSEELRYKIKNDYDTGIKINETITTKSPIMITFTPFISWNLDDDKPIFPDFKNHILINSFDDNGGLVVGIRYLRDVDNFSNSEWKFNLSVMDLITHSGYKNGVTPEVCMFNTTIKQARVGVCTGPYIMSGETVGIMDIIGIYQITKHWNFNFDLIRTTDVGSQNGLDVALFGTGYSF
jgi:hypothetical protein